MTESTEQAEELRRTPLASLHQAAGAKWMARCGWEIPREYAGAAAEYRALREGVGLIDLSHRSKLRITGRDRRSWLHGQVTQDVKNLPEWRGAPATVLTPQGKMVRDLRIFALPDALIVDAPPNAAADPDVTIAEYLDRYLIMERAEIEDLTDQWALLSLQGPHSLDALTAVLDAAVPADWHQLPPWSAAETSFGDTTVTAVRTPHCGEDGFDLFVPAEAAAALWNALSGSKVGVQAVGWDALNVRRIEAGIPWWGEELDSTLVPLEARLEHAIHFHKGCYVGQEIIARIEARGHVNNLLTGFLIHGDRLPARSAEIHHEGKRVGRIRTVAHSFGLGRPIALGYLRRELQESGTRVEATDVIAPIELEVTSLPFLPHSYPQNPGSL